MGDLTILRSGPGFERLVRQHMCAMCGFIARWRAAVWIVIMNHSSSIFFRTRIMHLHYSSHAHYAFALFLAHIMHLQEERHQLTNSHDELKLCRSELFAVIDDVATNSGKVVFKAVRKRWCIEQRPCNTDIASARSSVWFAHLDALSFLFWTIHDAHQHCYSLMPSSKRPTLVKHW